jgi:NTP pyrophosphatase (non-canonical NTP hydrolase)
MLTLNEYQDKAMSTAVYPGQNSPQGFIYTALGLNGEAGEVAEHAKKLLRDDNGEITPERRPKILKELGDQLWYIAACARELGFTLEEVAVGNNEKLADRAERGQLGGSGDDR